MRHPRYPHHVLRRPLLLLRPRARQEKRPRREWAVWSTVRPRALPIVPSTQSAVPQYIARWKSTEWACILSGVGLQKRGGDQGTVGPPRVLCLRYQYMHQSENAPLHCGQLSVGRRATGARLLQKSTSEVQHDGHDSAASGTGHLTRGNGGMYCHFYSCVFVIKKRGCLSIETTIFREYQSRRDQRPTSKVL